MTINKVMTKGFDNPLAKFDEVNAKLARFYSTQNKIREIQKAFELPNAISQMLKDIDNLTTPIKALQPTLNLATAGTAFTQSQSPSFLARMLAPQRTLLDGMTKLYPQISPLLTQLGSTTSGVFFSKFLTDNLDLILPKLPALNSEHLALLEEAAQNISDISPLSESDLSEFSDTLKAAQAEPSTRFWDSLLKDPKSLLVIVLFYMLQVLGNMGQNYVYDLAKAHNVLPYLNNPTSASQKEVVTNAKKDLCLENLRVCKYVDANMLYVRAEGRRSSFAIDSLQLGQGVFVIERDESRSWSFIEYFDSESQQYRTGWVFSRYLKPYIK
ncbi:SH3 domain-containing protein [Shewanella sp. SP1S2-4]|uniref:SH3 domain-containing protein n=1 Tax=Shewanella sp. SP1S2-4 TaxID=3063537 RepID=UPI00288E6808|nr:SH3 domain-containing protein [Shewanella sp. SP1S2-4]MDT3319256.1 SH3 domain-containing protein [Shewanella sp. SP1S2-4]